MRRDQFSEDERRAQAADRINKFNTQHRQELAAANRATLMGADRYNIDADRGRERRNVDRRQAGAEQHADAYRTKYDIERSKVAGRTGAGSDIADVRGQKAGRMEQATGQLLEDAGNSANEFAQSAIRVD